MLIKLRRYFLLGGGIFIAVLLTGFFYARSHFDAAALAAELGRRAGAVCRVGEVNLSWSGVTLRHVSFAAPEAPDAPFCAVDSLTLQLDDDAPGKWWRGEPLTFAAAVADGVFFDANRFTNFNAPAPAPAAAAPAVSSTPPLATASTVAAFTLASFTLKNVRWALREREVLFTEIAGSLRDRQLPFTARGAIDGGKIFATGKLEFAFAGGGFADWRVESSLTIERLPLKLLTDCFPDTFDFVEPRGFVTGKSDLACDGNGLRGGEFNFLGAMRLDDVGAHLFDEEIPLPPGDCEFAGSYDYAARRLSLDAVRFRGAVDSFDILGTVDSALNQTRIQIVSEGLSWAIACDATGNRFLADYFAGLVHFNGFITYDNGVTEMKGSGGSQELRSRRALAAPLGKITLKTEVGYKSDTRRIWLNDMFFECALGGAAGEVYFPWFADITADNFACDLTLSSYLPPVGKIIGQEWSGTLLGKITAKGGGGGAAASNASNAPAASDAPAVIKYQVELNSLDTLKATLNNPLADNAPAMLDFGKFALRLNGEWRDGDQKIEQLQIASAPLTAAFNGRYAHRQRQATLGYNLRLQPRRLLPLLGKHLPESLRPSLFGEVAWQGYATLTPDALVLQKNEMRGALLPDAQTAWDFALTGDANLSRENFAIDNAAMSLTKEAATLLTANFSGKRSPDPTLTLTARGKWRAAQEIAAIFGLPAVPLVADELRLQATLTAAAEKTLCSLKSEFSGVTLGGWLRPQTLSVQARGAAGDGEQNWDELKLALGGTAVSASGKTGARGVDLQLTAATDLARTQAALAQPSALKLTGVARQNIHLTGNGDALNLTATGGAETLTFAGEKTRILSAPEWSGEISLLLRDGNPAAIKIKKIEGRAGDWTLNVAAQIDRLAATADGWDFGKGAAAKFGLTGTARALGEFLPELRPYLAGAGDAGLGVGGTLYWSPVATPPQWTVADGKFYLRRLQWDKLTASDLQTNWQWRGGVLALSDGNARCAGNIAFNAALDFRPTPARGVLDFRGENLSLPIWAAALTPQLEILSGELFIPAPAAPDAKEAWTRATWRGLTADEWRASLEIADLRLLARDVTARTVKQKLDLQPLLADFHHSVASELANLLNDKINRDAGKPAILTVAEARLTGNVKNQTLFIKESAIDGKNLADLTVGGEIGFDRRLNMKITARDRLDRHIDAALLLDNPQVKMFIESLPANRRDAALQLLPEWLNQLAQSGKLWVGLTGALDRVVVDWSPTRQAIRDALPELAQKVVLLASQSAILQDLLGKNLNVNPQPGKPLINLDDLF
ncbi:MAG: hypothetical protein LBP75_04165 [Planctomycetota bacterium]|jgi:hypothetical protein|nr:hypothetical protein [Planctomycetota bacterium]